MQGLTTREKIAHLLRRFGFGATRAELDRLEPFGVEGTLNWLLDYEKQEEGFPIDVYEVCFEPDMKDVYVDGFRFAGMWGLRMVLSQRPLEQKLALFWHDHFAVSAAKVEFGPAMWTYLETLRTNALDFPKLLHGMAKDPAMLRYLDGDTSLKQQPNENFARELLELFTLGQGNYTEKDIDEIARAFTGWGIRYLIYESGGEMVQERLREAILKDIPMLTASFSAELNDTGVKDFLGTKAVTAEEVLDKLAVHPRTAEYITGKLWDYFAAVPASVATKGKLAAAFLQNKGSIKPVLRVIAGSDEFWSEKCVRHRIKSPADFVVPIVRQLGLNPIIRAMYTKPPSRTRPLPKPLRDTAGLVVGTMYQQGMLLFFPPDVGGWEWGEAWITSNNMLARMNMADLLCGVGQKDHPIAGYLALQMNQAKLAGSDAAIDFLCTTFDAPLPVAKRKVLVEAFDKNGGMSSLSSPATASKSLSQVLKLMFGSPEFQMC